MKLRASTATIPLPASPLKGEEQGASVVSLPFKGRVGVGMGVVSFTRHFYKPQPLRTLEEISADILSIEKDAGDEASGVDAS
ncbi:MAG: hypothetical protein Q8O31_02390 [Rhodocyclaceae bacterium]|nr:hypothetical protein [Rhodocyclaceae bacterium]